MSGELGTTNLFLGIMAVVSALEGLLIIGMGIAAFIAYRRVMDLVAGLEKVIVTRARLLMRRKNRNVACGIETPHKFGGARAQSIT